MVGELAINLKINSSIMKKITGYLILLILFSFFKSTYAQSHIGLRMFSLKEKNLKKGVKTVHEKYLNGNMLFNFVCTYDNNGNLTTCIDTTSNSKTTYTYNQTNNLIETKYFKDFDTYSSNTTIEYAGNKSTTKESSGETTMNTYDNNNNIIETKTFDNAGKLTFRGTKKYDAKGNKIAEEQIVGWNKGKRVYSYDVKGNCTGVVDYLPDGQIRYSMAYKYDKAGNLIEENLYADNKLGWGHKFQYKDFDKAGNWLTAIIITYTSNDSEPITHKRVITYY